MMSVLKKKNEEKDELVNETDEQITEMQLIENDLIIIEQIQQLHDKIDGMAKNNKKFLMASTMNDGRVEKLEKEISELKLNVINLLDHIEILQSAIQKSDLETLKSGMGVYNKKIVEITSTIGLQPIVINEKTKFDALEMECTKFVTDEKHGDQEVVSIEKSGYKDVNTGRVLRYAKVIVNKL